MNYFEELNLFWRSGITNYLTPSASLLYLAILDIANERYWPEVVVIPSTLLQGRTGIEDPQTFWKARNRLKQAGLIEFISRQGSSRCGYKVLGTQNGLLQMAKSTIKNPCGLDSSQDSFEGDFGDSFEDGFQDSTGGETQVETQGETGGETQVFNPLSANDLRPPKTKRNKTNNSTSLLRKEDASRDSPPTNKDLIIELVQRYREIPGVTPRKGDYAFMGRMYNKHGYDEVVIALDSLRSIMQRQHVEDPMVYLNSILQRRQKGRIELPEASEIFGGDA
ncbi:MAG TPA: hypothetical protein GXX51_06895 [Firmicutes bacterium]|nr:hypothetical protein [Bacillota bacterium]